MSILELKALTPFQQLGLIDISYSRLDTYTTCPAKYFYSYITREEREWGAAAALGSSLHGTLENFYGNELKLIEMFSDLEHQRERFDPDRQIPEELMNAGRVMLAEFQSRHEHETPNILGKEVPFQIVIGAALVSGFIDVLELRKDCVTVVDYKSGRAQVAEKDIPTNLQLNIYALAAAHLYPENTVRAELYYLRTGKSKGHTYSAQDLIEAEQRVALKVEELINAQSFPYTKTGACHWCDYRKNGVCGKFAYSTQ